VGIISQAWSNYRLAKLRQRELQAGFRELGVANPEHLDTKFTTDWIKEAMATDAPTVVSKYAPIVRFTMSIEGRVVTRQFNKRLADLALAKMPASGVIQFSSLFGSYKLNMPISGADDIVEFSAEEYDEIGGRSFKDEVDYNAPVVEFCDQRWLVKLQTIDGQISKTMLRSCFEDEKQATAAALKVLYICKDRLGEISEQETGLFIWDAPDGNLVLSTAPTSNGFEIMVTASASYSSIGAQPLD
jgi:hypothetical protein